MRKCRNLVIAAVAGATMLVGALPAGAHATGLTVVTVDQHAAGRADLVRTGAGTASLQVCDMYKDGFGVDAWVTYNRQQTAGVMASNVKGANNGCVAKPVSHRGTVWVNVCLNDHDGKSTPVGGPVGAVFCSGWTPVRL